MSSLAISVESNVNFLLLVLDSHPLINELWFHCFFFHPRSGLLFQKPSQPSVVISSCGWEGELECEERKVEKKSGQNVKQTLCVFNKMLLSLTQPFFHYLTIKWALRAKRKGKRMNYGNLTWIIFHHLETLWHVLPAADCHHDDRNMSWAKLWERENPLIGLQNTCN